MADEMADCLVLRLVLYVASILTDENCDIQCKDKYKCKKNECVCSSCAYALLSQVFSLAKAAFVLLLAIKTLVFLTFKAKLGRVNLTPGKQRDSS